MGYDMVMTGIYWSDFYTRYILYIILFRMRYAEYILKLKNLYIFYTTYILPGFVDVLAIYLGYDKCWGYPAPECRSLGFLCLGYRVYANG